MATILGKELVVLAVESTEAKFSQSIIDSVADIVRLQSVYVANESRRAFLKRGIDKSTILCVDKGIKGIIMKLFGNPYHDRDDVLNFQQNMCMYVNSMTIEMACLGREMTKVNSLCAKRRVFHKSVCGAKLFKICDDYLSYMKASETVKVNRINELLWKCAQDAKDASFFDRQVVKDGK